tara:strand:- start:26478 stop:26984 length:507 start_codon:yes stop_codon:yes gene_type:complete
MFQKIGSLGRFGGPVLVDRVITNSVVVAIGDSVKTASGFGALGTAGDAVLGHVVAVVGADGLNPKDDATFNGNLGTAFTAASDNQTVDQVKMVVDVAQDALYIAELDAAAGTTTGSDLAGYNMDLVDEDTLDESTAAETAAQYYSHGLDSVKTTQVVVNIKESEVFNS